MLLTIQYVGVVGSGTMGSGIAQICAQNGYYVYLYDVNDTIVQKSLYTIEKRLQKMVEKGKITKKELEQSMERIEACTELSNLKACDVVIEAVPEKLPLKKEIFRQLEGVCSEQTILATNTSSFSVTDIASAVNTPERVVGLHFFNPVPLMPLVEIIKGFKTSEKWIHVLLRFADSLGKEAVICEDRKIIEGGSSMKVKSHYPLFINGEYVDSKNGELFDIVNPATEEVIATAAKAAKEDVDKAVQAARTAFESGKWPKMTAAKRARILNKIANIMRERFDDLVNAEVLNSGKTVDAAKGQINQAIEDFEFYSAAAITLQGDVNQVPNGFFNYTVKEPVGVCGQIIPWNYPLMMAAWKVAPALAAGCTVVLKPASYTPITAYMLAEICLEAGVPNGVVNVITGSGSEIGPYMTQHPGIDKVAFTGETETGKDIMKRASDTLKRVTLELGGKSPNIVFDDCDLEEAVNGSLFGIFYNTGQSCEARSRLFVHESIYDEFMEMFLEKASRVRVGDPFAKGVHMGAVISKSHQDVIDGYVKLAVEEGGKILYGGKVPEGEEFRKGYWYMPTIIGNVTNDMRVAQEEIFGPVVVVMKFSEEEEVIRQANDTIFGLGSCIWTKDHGRAHRVSSRIRAGIVMVNCPISAFPGTPFGGYKQSGFGRELALETLNLYMETKSVVSYVGGKPLNMFGI